ncbi:hypothetical protein ACOMICROBIO_FLGHMIGD_00358 [Vibrio sp. B1FLJ16]|uniref:hypothetical protein n=1 Tax=Vibrio sp. B1FLJ16 TaxID=2751178 RepID=UPI0015F51D00|nr:hypothetical protein [Vibrio sp. B1FLJ16]CAD7798548.1 hypothetical protein ACOMICROBIO_FLGHMIGD_00358 [Vibrio sp. B1FLJ16]CAE6883072.1 hypothetical protein ACOMICROBIO_FLGHMIGD_00358 [Vibrio sp. B1FLJ16]
MPDAEFLEDYDLALLNEQSNIVPYTYDALRDNYTNGIFKIFSGHKARTIFGLDTQQILLERLQRESERDKGLGRIFLQQNFKDDLKKIGKLDVWQKHKKDIISLSDAPYVTGIPQILRTNPIYSPSHQESFQLAYTQKPEIIEKGTGIDMSTGLNLSTYEQALAMLQPDDIFYLRDTYEFRQYQKHVRNGVSTDSQLDNALMALKAYQRQIDELIIRRKLGKKTPKSFKGKRFIEPIRKISQEGSVTAFGLTLVEPTSAVALSIANFFLSELLGKREKLSADRIELEKEKLVSNIKRESNGEPKKIEAHQFSSTDINETIYTSVSMLAKQ